MSFADAPSKDEAMRWNTQTLADYMRRLNVSSCDNLALQRSKTGAQLMVACSEGTQSRCNGTLCYTCLFCRAQRSGDDQEYFEKKTEQENFICPVFQLQRAEEQCSGEENDITQTWEIPGKPSRSPRVQDGHREGSAAVALGSWNDRFIQQRPPLPTNVFNRSYPVPPVSSHPPKFNKPIPEPKKCLDPSWYGGNMTRRAAEAALRAVNKDGAFIVRDSSNGSDGHPHTLMLLNQGKVYNIRIRRQGNSYLLGNGFNSTKSFPEVTELITHHMNTPLVLIDATDQSAAEKPKCCLLHPAGL